MDAAVSVSLHHHRALPLHPRRSSISSSSAAPSKAPAARLSLAARPASPARSAHAVPAAVAAAAHSSRAATGYAAALADSCVRAGTLRRASRHARALLFRHRSSSSPSSSSSEEEAPAAGRFDARVAALVRMLVSKGKAGMVGEVMAEFAAICDQLLPLPVRAHAN